MTKKTETSTNGSHAPLETLKAVYEFMTKNGLDSVEVVEDGASVKLVRRKAATTQVPVIVPVAAGGASYAPSAAPASSAPAAPSAPALPAGTPIKSPMMGIFYRAPSPSSPPFVKEGDQVKPGQVICMIEAMKVFNEVKAEYPFTVVKVLLENGKPIKSGQDLFIVAR